MVLEPHFAIRVYFSADDSTPAPSICMHNFPFMNVADVSVITEYLEWHLTARICTSRYCQCVIMHRWSRSLGVPTQLMH